MKKFLKLILIFLLLISILLNLTGCYDARGIEELAYVVAIGLDINENNELELSLQFATQGNSSGEKSEESSSNSESSEGSSQSSNASITTVKCTSINSGLALINNHISKKVNLSHCQEILISEKLAKQGLSEYLDTLLNNIQLRTDCSIVITKCDAREYLENVKPSLESLVARYYESSLHSAEYVGYTIDITLSEFYSKMKDTYSQAYAILGNINENSLDKPTHINADYTAGENPIKDSDMTETLGIAVFNGDKMVGELTGLDSLCHIIVNNNLEQCSLSVPNPFEKDKYLDLILTSEKNTKCTVELNENSANIHLDVYLVAYGQSLDEKTKYNSNDKLKQIENSATKYLHDQIQNYLYKTSREYSSDISGFGKYAVKHYLTLDDWYNSNWLDNYKNSNFNVNVHLIMKSGNIFTKS